MPIKKRKNTRSCFIEENRYINNRPSIRDQRRASRMKTLTFYTKEWKNKDIQKKYETWAIRAPYQSSRLKQNKAAFDVNDKNEKAKDSNGNVIIKEVNTLVETRDGSIASFPITTRCLLEINRPNAYLSGASDLSKDLEKCPEGFIENLKTVNSSNVDPAPQLLL